MAKSVQQTIDRYKAGTAGAQTAYTDGVQQTTVDVMQRAIAAAPSAVQNYAASIASGAWAAAINASGGTSNWKAMSVAKAANYGVGVQAGLPKFQAAMGKLLPFIEQTVASLPPKQSGNLAVSLARVQGLMTALHNAKGQFKG
jgi:hypothetical protein